MSNEFSSREPPTPPPPYYFGTWKEVNCPGLGLLCLTGLLLYALAVSVTVVINPFEWAGSSSVKRGCLKQRTVRESWRRQHAENLRHAPPHPRLKKNSISHSLSQTHTHTHTHTNTHTWKAIKFYCDLFRIKAHTHFQDNTPHGGMYTLYLTLSLPLPLFPGFPVLYPFEVFNRCSLLVSPLSHPPPPLSFFSSPYPLSRSYAISLSLSLSSPSLVCFNMRLHISPKTT